MFGSRYVICSSTHAYRLTNQIVNGTYYAVVLCKCTKVLTLFREESNLCSGPQGPACFHYTTVRVAGVMTSDYAHSPVELMCIFGSPTGNRTQNKRLSSVRYYRLTIRHHNLVVRQGIEPCWALGPCGLQPQHYP